MGRLRDDESFVRSRLKREDRASGKGPDSSRK
jgi:hypothetical protein